MSASTIMESFDAPMLDYSGDMDVHMHTTLSSPKPWTQPETIMEEDVHPIQLPNPFPSHLPQQDVEIDMDDYYNENVEYEMADGEFAVADTELVDIDVYDATREEAASASASISHPTSHTDQHISKRPAGDHYLPSESEVATDHIPAMSNLEPSLHQSAEPELLTPAPLQTTAVHDYDTKPLDQSGAAVALQESTSPSEDVTKDSHSDGEPSTTLERHAGSPPRIATADGTSDNVTFRPIDGSEQERDPAAEHESSASVPQTVTAGAAIKDGSHQADTHDGESHEGVRVHEESHEGDVSGPALDGAEAGEPEHPAAESHETGEEGDADLYEISEGVYIEPPPPILIELPSTSDQPVYTLFNAPADLRLADNEVNVPNDDAPYTVLLQSRPTLYYETLNDVFDALREEEHIQSIAAFVDGEMAIDAYDLQLVVSEDNVHAREISLHDLNILHHGLGLIGPLRLRLRTVLPRFINRYRSLQGQMTRLSVARSTSHPAEDSGEQASVGSLHERDPGYYDVVNDDGQTKLQPTGDGGHEEPTGGVDEHEDVESTYLDHAEYQGEHEEADRDESEQYADAQEYPHALEREESDQFVTNDESEPLPDSDPTHEGAADPESTEYQEPEHEGHEEGEASGDAGVTSTTTVTTYAKETDFPGDELHDLTDVQDSAVTGESQIEEFEERQVLITERSSSGSVYGDEQAEADGFSEDAEAEADVTGDESAQSTGSKLGIVTNEEERGAASHENTGEYGAQEAELPRTEISSRAELSEPASPYLHTEEDEENAESWELDDGYAIWTVEDDEFDSALVGEPDSVSTDSSTLSGSTAPIASKRSFEAVDESEPAVEQSLPQNLKKTRTR